MQLPSWLSGVHDVFHVSSLRKYVHDPDSIIEEAAQQDIEITPNLTVRREPIKIVDRDEKRLRNKVVKLVKVQWSGDPMDCTWETEDNMKKSYPNCMVDISA